MSRDDRRVMLRAALGLPLIAIWLRATSLARVQEGLGRSFRSNNPDPARRGEIAEIVSKVASHHPYSANCLERSLALWWLLGRCGIPSEIRFGVRPAPEDGSPDFHSWVENEGVVLNDRPDIATEFIPFDQPIGRLPKNLV